MRYFLLILLGLSLPALADQAGQQQAPQTKSHLASPPSDIVVTPPCDADLETKMPDFN